MTADPTPGADPRHVPGVPQGVTRSDGSVEDREFCIYDHEPWPCPAADPRLAELTEALRQFDDADARAYFGVTSRVLRAAAPHTAAAILALLPARTATEAEALAAAQQEVADLEDVLNTLAPGWRRLLPGIEAKRTAALAVTDTVPRPHLGTTNAHGGGLDPVQRGGDE